MSVVTDYLKGIYKLLIISELILDDHISIKKVLKIINKLLNRKTIDSDRILNEVLKRITLKISVNLAQRIHTTLICSLLSTCYKKSIIIILYKKNKKNYLLLKSYKLITLKNMLVKIIKKMLVTYLNYIAEKYSLLL